MNYHQLGHNTFYFYGAKIVADHKKILRDARANLINTVNSLNLKLKAQERENAKTFAQLKQSHAQSLKQSASSYAKLEKQTKADCDSKLKTVQIEHQKEQSAQNERFDQAKQNWEQQIDEADDTIAKIKERIKKIAMIALVSTILFSILNSMIG